MVNMHYSKYRQYGSKDVFNNKYRPLGGSRRYPQYGDEIVLDTLWVDTCTCIRDVLHVEWGHKVIFHQVWHKGEMVDIFI